jgi:diaminohydroxyphosphoribosylaminopyrimidine deaminase/5-amino-6-(5-phosphoribosylamino)uracil reductase
VQPGPEIGRVSQPDAGSWPAPETAAMALAIAAAQAVRHRTPPNPWVGAVVLDQTGTVAGVGATERPGGRHAEIVALAAAGDRARGGTVVTTLEPCGHEGRTGPCTEAIARAGVRRVVVGVSDPDPAVDGRGVAALADAGIDVAVGLCGGQVAAQLAPYLVHRREGRPLVVLKLATSADGRIAAPDGSSAWITGPAARADAHRLRAGSDAVLVGAGTVRRDDPQLTVRDARGRPAGRQPLRVVLGAVPDRAAVAPALALSGPPAEVLAELARRGVLQVLVEGGATVARSFHEAGLVDRYVIYWAPSFFGGDDALGMFSGPGVPTVDERWRGRLVGVRRLGTDLRIDLAPDRSPGHPPGATDERKVA